MRVVLPVLVLAALLGVRIADAGKVPVGASAPDFRLETLRGQKVDLDGLKGKATVLVVARARSAAKRCKKWVVSVDEALGRRVSVYQVIVIKKPWYLPEFVVKNKIESLIPKRYHHHVLIEWRDHFAKQFGIPKDSTPTVLLLGPDGKLRWQHRGVLSDSAWGGLQAALPSPTMISRR